MPHIEFRLEKKTEYIQWILRQLIRSRIGWKTISNEIETKKGDIKINNPNNRPSAKDPMFDDDDEIHIDKPKKPEFKSNKQMGKNSQDDSMEDLLMSQLGLNDD